VADLPIGARTLVYRSSEGRGHGGDQTGEGREGEGCGGDVLHPGSTVYGGLYLGLAFDTECVVTRGFGSVALCFEVESAVDCFIDGGRRFEGFIWTAMAVTCAGFNVEYVCDVYVEFTVCGSV
jgi:hypothetical protein